MLEAGVVAVGPDDLTRSERPTSLPQGDSSAHTAIWPGSGDVVEGCSRGGAGLLRPGRAAQDVRGPPGRGPATLASATDIHNVALRKIRAVARKTHFGYLPDDLRRFRLNATMITLPVGDL